MADLLDDLIFGASLGGLFAALGVMPAFAPPPIARAATFVNRFAIGFAFGALAPPVAPWLGGMIAGLLLALTDATGARRWAPFLGFGAIAAVALWLVVRG